MINNVSFGAITTDPTSRLSDEIINQPNAYASQPSAAASMQGDKYEKKGGIAKKVVGIAAVAAAVVAALAFGAKKVPKMKDAPKFLKNMFLKPLEEGVQGPLELTKLGKIGTDIADKAGCAFNSVKNHIPFLKKGGTEAAEAVVEAAVEATT